MSCYQFIDAYLEAWPVQALCRLFTVNSAGYYQWCKRPDRPAAEQPAAQAAFTRYARRYGTQRLRAGLHTEGHDMGRYAICS